MGFLTKLILVHVLFKTGLSMRNQPGTGPDFVQTLGPLEGVTSKTLDYCISTESTFFSISGAKD